MIESLMIESLGVMIGLVLLVLHYALRLESSCALVGWAGRRPAIWVALARTALRSSRSRPEFARTARATCRRKVNGRGANDVDRSPKSAT